MKKILILAILIIFTSAVNAKYGIGYLFFGQLVSKKVYESPKRNKMRISNIPIKMQNGPDLINDFKLILSKRGINEFSRISPYYKRVSHPLKTTKINKVLRVKAKFKHAWNNYIELRPKKKIVFPKWVKSIDFWIYGIRENLDVYIYLSTKPNSIRRIKMGRLDYIHWKRMYANIFDVKYKNERQVHLVKIRIVGHKQNAVKDLITYIAGFKIYNFKRTEKNLYLDPVNILYDLDKTDKIKWELQIGEQKEKRNFFRRLFNQQRNSPILHLFIPQKTHANRDCMIHFSKKLVVLKNYDISIWIYGTGKKEKISLIFRDFKKRVFEIEFVTVKFNGWRRMVLIVPDKFFIRIGRGEYIRPRFIELWGMKISPSYNQDIEFRMGDIKTFRDFRFERYKIPSR